MRTKRQKLQLAKIIREYLEPVLKGVKVEVSSSARWERPVVMVRWAGFSDLLAEQRFRRVIRCFPKAFYEQKLQELIWFELTPEQSIDAYLAMPRSEDMNNKSTTISKQLKKRNFYAKLAESLGNGPRPGCDDNFTRSRAILKSFRYSQRRIEECCLMFISQGAYCDCEVLTVTQPNIISSLTRS